MVSAGDMTAFRHAELPLRRDQATRRNEAVTLGHDRGGRHQQGDELPPLGNLDDVADLHLVEVAARVLTELSYTDPRHAERIAPVVLRSVERRPVKRRLVLFISAITYNRSRLATVLAAVITSNTALEARPGNVFLPATMTGLPRDSVVDLTALVTLNEADLIEHVGNAPPALLNEVDRGLRRVPDL